ncbi:lecithin retinol acyltransferase family protein [Paraburkholderia sp. CNPSo 3274]|uniref:lecithin retinol acyltransferase family protein n=1 Tax=Paraburkholderia sp. CNPSo 3274 TaxID=2940932 RepID=UPI0020B8721D|nr:lecithin retinol acyltransferase family protein [Paraburkholderia sp. CNPSo 3274]MCP3709938.1 lecithin retinol acyltransferase family protein [Paraburkholderia sp. CNPSo 3274]
MDRDRHQSGSERDARCAAAYAPADVVLDGSNGELALGAHLITKRHGYEHHGIYVGSGMVIHYAGFAKSVYRGPVEEVPIEQFAGGHTVSVRARQLPTYSGAQAVRRARSRLGENRYRLLTNNCEHFCTWCLLGESRSEQVHACLRRPLVGVHALLCLVSTFIGNRSKTDHAVVSAA